MAATIQNGRNEVVTTLRGVLTVDNSLSRCWAVKALSKLEVTDAETIQQLIGLLYDPDVDVRMDAATALGELRSTTAVERLLESVASDPEGDVRIQAVGALAKIGSKESVGPLIECVRNDGYAELDLNVDDMQFASCWEVQGQAMAALGEIGDPQATTAIMELLADDDYQDLWQTGFRILAKMNTPEARAYLIQQVKADDSRTRRWAIQAVASLPDYAPKTQEVPAELLGCLAEALMDKDPAVRVAAIHALEGVANPLVIVPIAMLLKDPSREVREEAISVLGHAQGADVLERLHNLTTDADHKLQRRVAVVLGEIGDPSSFTFLSQMLNGDDEDLNYAVAHSLGQVAVAGAEQRLSELLAAPATPVNVRIKVAQALGKTLPGLPAVTEVADAAEVQESDDDQGTDVEAELQYDPESVLWGAVLDPSEALGLASLQALAEAYPETIVERLIWLLDSGPVAVIDDKDEEPDADQAAAAAEAANAEALTAAIGDKEPVSSTLASIVAGLPGEQSAAEKPADTPDTEQPEAAQPAPEHTALRVAAAAALAELENPNTSVVRALRRAFETGSVPIRQAALQALIRIGGEEVSVVVQDALADEAIDIRLAALPGVKEYIAQADYMGCITDLAADANPYVRASTIAALGQPDIEMGLSGLISAALQDDEIDVCRAALGALNEQNCTDECVGHMYDLMFRFSAELRHEAAGTLRRCRDITSTPRLLGSLDDEGQEEIHWICIDALADIHAADSTSLN